MKQIFQIFLILCALVPSVHGRGVNTGALNYVMNFDACADNFPNKKPVLRRADTTEFELCNSGYAVLYEGKYKIPKVAFARITPEQLREAKTLSREGIEFVADPRLPPQYRSSSQDYLHSGMDRGHMIGNAFFGKDGQLGSFLMSNISPQHPNLNREVFSKVESDTRKYIRRVNRPVYIAVGQTHRADRCLSEVKNRVCVIDQLFIAVYDPANGKSWAHIMQNSANAVNAPTISLKELEKQIAYSFWEIK